MPPDTQTTPAPPKAPAPPGDPFIAEALRQGQEQSAFTQQLIESMGALLPQYQQAQKFEAESLKARQERLTDLEGQQKQMAKDVAATPEPGTYTEPPVPHIQLRPFGEGLPGESAAQTLNRTLMSLGLMVQMGFGLAGNYPQGALAAFTGALTGWQRGDKERAEQDWLEYQAQVGKAAREWRASVQKFEALRQKHADNLEQFKLQLGMEAARSGYDDRMVQLMFRAPDEAQKILGMQGKALQDLFNGNRQLTGMMLQAKIADDRLRQTEVHFQQNMAKWRESMDQRERFHKDMQQRAQTTLGIREYTQFVKPVEAYVSAWDGLEKLKGAIVNLDRKGLLPKNPTAMATVFAGWDRDVRAKGDPDVVLFRQLWGPVVFGAVDRGMFDEKNVRAMAMFKEQIGALDNIAPAKALTPLMTTLQGIASRKVREKATAASAYNLTPATLDLIAGYERSVGSYDWQQLGPGGE